MTTRHWMEGPIAVCAMLAMSCGAAEGQDGDYGSSGGGAGASGAAATGGHSNQPATGGAGGSSGQGGQGAATLPDPGPPPAGAIGVLMASKIAQKGEDDHLGMSAIFTNPAINLGTTAAQAMLSGYQNVPLDECKNINAGPQVVSSDQPNLIDAGDILVLAPDGQTYPVPKQQFASFIFYEGSLPAAAFSPVGEYRLIGAGWEGPFWSPGPLDLLSPALESDPVPVPRSQPFTLEWTGTPDGHPVMIFLIQGSTVITCRVADDGRFEVPSAALMAFEPSGGAFDPSPDEPDEVIIERLTWYPIAPKNGLATALVQFEVGARVEVEFE